MTTLVTLGTDNQLIINQEKLQEMMELKNYPIEKQAQFLQQAVNQSLVHQAGLIVQAALLDRDLYRDKWLQQKRSGATVRAYKKAIEDFFSYLDRNGIASPVLVTAEQADDYLHDLKQHYSDNSVRARIASCSSFYSYLNRLQKIDSNPFNGVALPKKRYKKAVSVDQEKCIPVMNITELILILDHIKALSGLRGKRSSVIKQRTGAKKLHLAVHFMSEYGLRAGAVESIEIQDGYFSYQTKGDKVGKKRLKEETKQHLLVGRYNRKPLAGYKKISMQVAVKKVTSLLCERQKIRYPYSCHDFRHYFAHEFYKNTGDLVRLKNEMDHASINVTDVYLSQIGL